MKHETWNTERNEFQLGISENIRNDLLLGFSCVRTRECCRVFIGSVAGIRQFCIFVLLKLYKCTHSVVSNMFVSFLECCMEKLFRFNNRVEKRRETRHTSSSGMLMHWARVVCNAIMPSSWESRSRILIPHWRSGVRSFVGHGNNIEYKKLNLDETSESSSGTRTETLLNFLISPHIDVAKCLISWTSPHRLWHIAYVYALCNTCFLFSALTRTYASVANLYSGWQCKQ